MRRLFTICGLCLATFLFANSTPAWAQNAPKPAQGPTPARDDMSTLWRWTKSKKHHQSVVKVVVGESIGTGVLLYVDRNTSEGEGHLGYCATAQHVIDQAEKQSDIRVEYQNGTKAVDCQVVMQNAEMDVAMLWVWVPKEMAAAKLGSRKIERGEPVEFVGLGGRFDFSKGLRHFVGKASDPTSSRKIYADQTLLPGDSGGPIFNVRQEVVGIISGGWFWWGDENIKTDSGNEFRATWPARGSNVIPLAALIAELPPCEIGKTGKPDRNGIVSVVRPRKQSPQTIQPDAPYVVYETVVPHPDAWEHWDGAVIGAPMAEEVIFIE